MADMLVKLYELPELNPVLTALRETNIEIRRAGAWEKHTLMAWVSEHFIPIWTAETQAALEQRPITCFIAVEKDLSPEMDKLPPYHRNERIIGFACYDIAGRGVFGPTGVREDYQKRGIGKGLLLSVLHAMYDEGYLYAIIGQVGPAEFYATSVGATLIEGSEYANTRRKLVK